MELGRETAWPRWYRAGVWQSHTQCPEWTGHQPWCRMTWDGREWEEWEWIIADLCRMKNGNGYIITDLFGTDLCFIKLWYNPHRNCELMAYRQNNGEWEMEIWNCHDNSNDLYQRSFVYDDPLPIIGHTFTTYFACCLRYSMSVCTSPRREFWETSRSGERREKGAEQ